MTHALTLSKPKFVFVSPYAAKRVVAVCKKLPFVKQVVIFGDRNIDESAVLLTDFIRLNANNNFDVEKNVNQKVNTKDQTCLIVCSSGTTGLPKGK